MKPTLAQRLEGAPGLLLLSFAVLFQELALIRWLPVAVRVLSYFPNLVLLSAFLGLGIGCLRAGKRSLQWTWPVAVLFTVLLARLLHGVAFTQESTSEHLWLLYGDLGPNAPIVKDVRPPILLFFLAGAAAFIGPGQMIAERLDRFASQQRPLVGYGWDLTGSLLGCCGFSLASFLWSPPPIWFAVVSVAALGFFTRSLRGLVLYALLAVGIVVGVGYGDKTTLYSPYYALKATPLDGDPSGASGQTVFANGSVHQYPLDLNSTIPRGDAIERARAAYRIPYRLLGHAPERVLILGAGTGNDVAIALSEGAGTIDAVEIDPGIRSLGALHPNKPYDSPRVHVHVTDARAFLNGSKDKYDLIVFGTLDSMTRLSALSSVRLDNFVYTVEGLRAAHDHLTEHGGIVLYFMVGATHIYDRLLSILPQAPGTSPHVEGGEFGGLFNNIYMSGPAFDRVDARTRAELDARLANVTPSTDDWPYLYLKEPGISGFYLSLIFALLAISAAAVFSASPELRASVSAGADVEMLLLGLAFLLLETKSVTEMALAWGVTWLTSAVVFAAILVMALLGTLTRKRWAIPARVSVLFIAVSLLVSWAVPTGALANSSVPPRLLLSILFVGTPIFWASSLFATAYSERTHVAVAFGWNLLGAVLGGLMEFLSMAIGIKALHLLALGAYLAVALLRERRNASAEPMPPGALKATG